MRFFRGLCGILYSMCNRENPNRITEYLSDFAAVSWQNRQLWQEGFWSFLQRNICLKLACHFIHLAANTFLSGDLLCIRLMESWFKWNTWVLMRYYMWRTLFSLIWRCVYRASYCNMLMTNDMHSSYNQFLFHSFFLSALHVSNESSRSSSGSRRNILYYTVQSVQSCRRV